MKRSKFNLSHYKLLSCNQGSLVPIGMVEVLPGDTIQHATSLLIRTQPLVTPVMHPVHVRVHHWFVPYRLLWSNWETFITGGSTPDSPPTFPYVTVNNLAVGSLGDYLGIPTGVAQNVQVSALPFRAYALIFNEFYRDQDLVTPLTIAKTDGSDATTNVTLKSCAWEKDYFTSSRPWAQKGNAVTLPLGTTAPVISNNDPIYLHDSANFAERYVTLTNSSSNVTLDSSYTGTTHEAHFGKVADLTKTGLVTDLSGATSATVNDIRLAMALQRYAEARARYGSRYTEYLRLLGVRSSDARLQRPEYLGGGKQTIQFSEVLQSGVTTSGNSAGVGTMRGHGISAARSNRYRRFFEEHGVVLSLLSVKPRTVYFQGLPRHWSRTTREDFFQKELQHVGQQEVLKKEIFMQGTSADAETWAYQDRYDEYRRMESSISGAFRTTLNTWHMARDLSSLPSINEAFITADPTNRVYAVTADPQLYVMAYHSMQARRLLSKVGTSMIL